MSKRTAWKAQPSIVLVALLVAFAPVYHAVCVAVASEASASAIAATMLMSDGTVMTHGSDAAEDSGMASATNVLSHTAPSSVTNPVRSMWPESSTLLGSILLIAGIVVLTVFFLKLWAQAARRIALRGPPRPAGRTPSPPPGLAWHGPAPDLTVLCISRT